jgi:nucleotide-binding universal stress UspA family protein
MPTAPRRFTHILCPTDFSDASFHAVDHAIAVAGWYAARLTLLHVCPPASALVPELPLPDNPPAPDMLRAREQIGDGLRAARAAGIPTDVLIDVGQTPADILNRAVGLPADLIVMGTHGAGGFEHLVLGSVTEKVLRRATCPVLTVPPRAHATSTLPFTRLLCAVDFSDWSLAALALAVSIAGESGAALTLVHVIEWPWEEPPTPVFDELPAEQASALREYRRYAEKSARARLRSLVPDAEGDRVSATSQVLHGKAYAGILRAAAEDRADLIVLGLHGRRALDVMLLGSTTNQVVRRATCPVLTLRR